MYILRYYLIIWFLLCCSLLVGQSDHTFLTYNLLNYEDEDDREDDFITVIEYVEPDIIIAQEVIGTSGYNHFQADVLEIIAPGEWSGATFINQSASIDIALFYRHDVFSFISTNLINTAQSAGTRDVVEWIMEHNDSGVQFNVYGLHFKASSGNANAQWRLAEATALRDYLDDLPAGSHFIVAGDFNIYSNSSSSEPAFDMLTGEGDDEDGRLFDPVDRIGHWHNNNSFADVHTQSPRSGSYGGMDDRFDWIFASESVLNETYEMNYVENSYWAVGNDGNHFNQAINDGNNSSVNDGMADALHDASDHLPVMAVLSFPGGDPSPYQIVITEVMVNPAAVSDSYGEWFELYNADTVTISMLDWLLLDSGSDEHNVDSISIAPGEYTVFGRNNDSSVNGGYNADYEYSGFQLANNEDEIMLIDDEGRVVDEIAYDSSFPYLSGASMYLKNTVYDNAVDTSWAMSEIPYGEGDYGTPGRAWDDTTSAGIDDVIGLPKEYVLYPAYPNPFNPTTTIRFNIVVTDALLLQVYDITGRVVETLVNKRLISGEHEIIWNASNQSSGVYFVRLSNSTFQQTKKLILLK
jgi:endonuclease/exonuclease/phosphatase family metal-dependent hydrolase